MKKDFHLYLNIFFIAFLLNSAFCKLINQKVGIAYGLNNQYTYPSLVSITSILENSFSHTYYIFYILIDKNTYKDENKIKFKNLEQKYERCEINIIEVSEESFKNANTKRYPSATYYRLLLAELVPDLNRIIYLDGDTLIYSDLSEMINLDMGNNIMLGFVDNSYHKAEEFGIKTYN